MKLEATLDGETRELEVTLAAGCLAGLSVDGEPLSVDILELRPGVYSVLAGRRSLEVYVEPAPDGGFAVLVDGVRRAVRIVDPRSYAAAGGPGAAAGRQEVRAPMPGKIVRVLVQQDQQVQTGEGILVVEAMKMQNEIKAAIDGRVVQLNAQAGDSVAAGQVLAILE